MDYRPIDCDFYDHLLATATRGRPVAIVFLADGEHRRVTDRITDVYTRQGAEYAQLAAGTTVRLDHLVGVDGEEPAGGCGLD